MPICICGGHAELNTTIARHDRSKYATRIVTVGFVEESRRRGMSPIENTARVREIHSFYGELHVQRLCRGGVDMSIRSRGDGWRILSPPY